MNLKPLVLLFLMASVSLLANSTERGISTLPTSAVAEPVGEVFSPAAKTAAGVTRLTFYRPSMQHATGAASIELNGRYLTSLQRGSPPVGVDDTVTAKEAGGTNNENSGTDPTGNVLANDTDPDGATTTMVVQDVRGSGVTVPLSATATSDARTSIEGNFGTLKIAADGSYTYVVNNSHAKVQALNTNSEPLTDTFIYTVKDATGLTSTATLSIDILGSNDAPIAAADEAINPNASINSTGNVLNNDSDVDNAEDSLVVQDVKASQGSLNTIGAGTNSSTGVQISGQYGTLRIGANGSYEYVVDKSNATVQAINSGDAALVDAFTYTVKDVGGLTSTATLHVSIQGTNDAPTGTDKTITLLEDSSKVFAVSEFGFSDVDGNTLSAVIITTLPSAGTLKLDGATVRFVSISNDSGETDDFLTNDNNGLTINATLSQALTTGQKVQYSTDGGTTWVDISASGITGTSVTHVDSTLTSSKTMKMRVVDGSGNAGTVASQDVVIDTTAPTTTVTISTVTDDIGISTGTVANNATTDDANPALSGTLSANLAAGETVHIFANGIDIGTAVAKVGTATWTFADTSNYANGTTVRLWRCGFGLRGVWQDDHRSSDFAISYGDDVCRGLCHQGREL